MPLVVSSDTCHGQPIYDDGPISDRGLKKIYLLYEDGCLLVKVT